ncbi:MAG: NAD(P)/FAD-dependent oxidoreductase [Caldisericia bacterium]|nr:NAD(P)/FAD-dependent oxidoreductase [Caldisericia bacterium]MDD4615238.1 NAD(P)/FAD-dependent oxidoreductase [Caldisericia bacterium]
MKNFNTVVIGAGPAGMMASIEASKKGTVCIIDSNPTPGRKLLLTGGGRCNVTVSETSRMFLKGIPAHSSFLHSSLHQFSPSDTQTFFQNRGVALKTEHNNAVFPASDKAETILQCIVGEMEKQNIVYQQATVQKVQIKENATFYIVSEQHGNTQIWETNHVILATGGKSYTHTGSTGGGYQIAQQLGHTIVPTEPGLIHLQAKPNYWNDCQGISLSSITLKWCGSKEKHTGDFIFTDNGFSGPVILNMSLEPFRKKELCIDFFPPISDEEWTHSVEDWRALHPTMKVSSWLQQWFPKKMVAVFLSLAEIQDTLPGAEFSKKDQHKLYTLLRGGIVNHVQKGSIEKAMVTLGGVHLKEVNPGTMESKIQPGLFFAGEVLDIAGKTGGYNIQIALSTGFVAGQLKTETKRGEA